MRASSSTSFGAARALTSAANQISHNRLGPRPSPFNVDATSPSPSRSARLKSRTQPFINSVDPSPPPLGLHSSTSDSKIWGKRRRRGRGAGKTTGAYSRVFALVFFACLVLFLHALSGSGSGVPPAVGDLYADPDLDQPSERIHTLRITRAPSTKNVPKAAGHGHDHLAVDPDGHYGYTSATRVESGSGSGSGSGHPWGWGKRARVTPGAGDGVVPGSGEEEEGVPEPTVDETPACQPSDSPHTPPPVSPPADARGVSTVTPRTALRDALSINPEETEMETEMDLPLFELGDPAYALRVHLPTSKSPPEEHRRGKRARARGAMLL